VQQEKKKKEKYGEQNKRIKEKEMKNLKIRKKNYFFFRVSLDFSIFLIPKAIFFIFLFFFNFFLKIFFFI